MAKKRKRTPPSNRKPPALHVNRARAALADRGTAPAPVRLLDKHDVCAIASVTYPTLWQWMRDGRFPRSRICGGKSMWVSTEVDAWITQLPIRSLKGDDTEAA